MNPPLLLPPFLLAGALAALALPSPVHARTSAKSPDPKPALSQKKNAQPAGDDALRLQLFLDRENFGPGKIDGHLGGFTKLAWLHWQQAHGVEKPGEGFDPKTPPLNSVEPLYTEYTVTAEDLAGLGPVPPQPPEQAKLKALTYVTLTELLGERFHSSPDFLKAINAPKNLDQLKEGETVKVPNVQPPFEIEQLGAYKAHGKKMEAEARKKKDAETAPANAAAPPAPSPSPEQPPAPAVVGASPAPSPAAPPVGPALPATPALSPAAYVHVSVKECYLELRDGDHIVAAFPVTPGSKAIPTPTGTWQIEEKALFPNFRWDKEMLEHGRRSKDAFLLPPGPNNPVGLVWIQLNKPGIGLHGTNEPDTIGRAASHGCVRLANWDAFKLYRMVNKGMKVIIE